MIDGGHTGKNKIATDARTARRTALTVAVVCALMAAFGWYRGRLNIARLFGMFSGALLIIGLFAPALALRFHVVWMRLAFALGYINSRILLSLFFYLVFVPYGLLSKLFGRDPLNRRGARQSSYWVPRKITRQNKDRFERLF